MPRRAFLRFEIPIPYRKPPPQVDANLAKWDQRCLAPPLIELEDQPPIADVYWAWNELGFYAAFDVPERRTPLRCDPDRWWKQDGLRLCIDTRDGRENKRATRFCHFFYILPVGGGRDGKAPIVGLHRMSRARETPPGIDVSRLRVAAQVRRRGYCVELAIPATCLHGWDPAEHNRIGVFYKVKDLELGSQHLCASDEMGWNIDPSTWATGVLVRA